MVVLHLNMPADVHMHGSPCSCAMQVAQILIDAKTDDVVVLDVRQQNCGFTDEMVIATARSKLHCQSAAQAVMYKV